MFFFCCCIADKVPPTFISCPQNKSFATTQGNRAAVLKWEDPLVSDNSDQVVNVYCDVVSESNFANGQTLVTCEAFDSSDNNRVCRFGIDVQGKVNFSKMVTEEEIAVKTVKNESVFIMLHLMIIR